MRPLPPDPFDRRSPRRAPSREQDPSLTTQFDFHDNPDSLFEQAPRPRKRRFRRLKRWLAINIAAFVVIWAILAVPFFFNRTPKVTRNIPAELSAPVLAFPRDSLAWPLYADYRARLRAFDPTVVAGWTDARPTDPDWPAAHNFITQHPELIPLLHRAASLPHLGCTLSDRTIDERDPTIAEPPASNPFMLGILNDHSLYLRHPVRHLALDARVAAEAGDAARAATSLTSIGAMAAHAREIPLLIHQLIAIASLETELLAIREILAAHPDLFSEAQLAAIHDSLFRIAPPGRVPLDFTAESDIIADYLQRTYSDDGHGDGRLGYQGVRFLDRFNSPRSSPSPTLFIFGPFNASFFMPSRQELAAEATRLYTAANADAALNDWERQTSQLAAFSDRYNKDPAFASRFSMVWLLTPITSKIIESQSLTSASREATAALVQIFRYRAKTGRFPDSLGELVPAYIPALPTDRFDGQPLRYRLDANGPLLYSIGVNKADDGGVPPKNGDTMTAAGARPDPHGRAIDGDWLIFPPPPDPKKKAK